MRFIVLCIAFLASVSFTSDTSDDDDSEEIVYAQSLRMQESTAIHEGAIRLTPDPENRGNSLQKQREGDVPEEMMHKQKAKERAERSRIGLNPTATSFTPSQCVDAANLQSPNLMGCNQEQMPLVLCNSLALMVTGIEAEAGYFGSDCQTFVYNNKCGYHRDSAFIILAKERRKCLKAQDLRMFDCIALQKRSDRICVWAYSKNRCSINSNNGGHGHYKTPSRHPVPGYPGLFALSIQWKLAQEFLQDNGWSLVEKNARIVLFEKQR